MTEIVIQGIGGRMGHVLCDMIAQREDCCVCLLYTSDAADEL